MKKFGNFEDPKRSMVLVPKAGANIFDCIHEALRLAADEDCDVSFAHNGRSYVVSPEEIRTWLYDKVVPR